MRGLRAAIASAAVLMLVEAASAQTTSEVPPQSIRVTGEATVTAHPDQVEIDIGVTTRAGSAQRVAADNAQKTARVVAELNELVGASGTTRTIGYSVHPEYRHPEEGREPEISGYVATHVVRVTMSELDRVGDLIDRALRAGANRVRRVQFTLKDEHAVHAQALRQAAARARSDAEALASALGVKIVRVLSAVEESAPVRPVVDAFRTAGLAAESTPTPVQLGTIDVDARVLLTVEVSGVQP
jgi:hypothetical protein